MVGLFERTGANMGGEHLTISDKTLTKTAIFVFDVVETDTRWVESDILHLRSGKKGERGGGGRKGGAGLFIPF